MADPTVTLLVYEDSESGWRYLDDDLWNDHEPEDGYFHITAPAELWARRKALIDEVSAIEKQITRDAGMHETETKLLEVCGDYIGEGYTHPGGTLWPRCSTCGWNRERHDV